VSGTVAVSALPALPAFASTPTFNVGTTGGLALDATLAARLGTLGQKAASGSAPVVLASDTALPLPAGASTLANDNTRASYFADIGPGTLGASTTQPSAARDAGASPSAFTKFNASFSAGLALTCVVQGSDDNATYFDLYQGTTTAPASGSTYGTVTVSLPVTFRYYRTKITTGGTATPVYVKSGFSVN